MKWGLKNPIYTANGTNRRRSKAIKLMVKDFWGNPVGVGRPETIEHRYKHLGESSVPGHAHASWYNLENLKQRSAHWYANAQFTLKPFENYIVTSWVSVIVSLIFVVVSIGIFFGATNIASESAFFKMDGSYTIFGVQRKDMPEELVFFILVFFGSGFLSHWMWYVVDPHIKRYMYTDDSNGGKVEERDISKNGIYLMSSIYQFERLFFFFLTISGLTGHIIFVLSALIGRYIAIQWATYIYVFDSTKLKPKHHQVGTKNIVVHPTKDKILIREYPTPHEPGIACVLSHVKIGDTSHYCMSPNYRIALVEDFEPDGHIAYDEQGNSSKVVGVHPSTNDCYRFVNQTIHSSNVEYHHVAADAHPPDLV